MRSGPVGVSWPRARGASSAPGPEAGRVGVVALVAGSGEGGWGWDVWSVVVESGAWTVELWPRSLEGHSYCGVEVSASREVPTCASWLASSGSAWVQREWMDGWMDGSEEGCGEPGSAARWVV